MTITTTEGKGGRLNIFADGEFMFSLDAAVWYSCKIRDGDEIDEETLLALKEEAVNRHALSSALNILTRRAHSEKELRFKLKQKYSESAVDYAIEKAAEMGFVDDADFAARYAEELSSQKRFAPSRIIAELIAKGIDRETAANTVDDLETDTEADLAYLLDYKYADFAQDEKHTRRAVTGLQRLGYSFSGIKAAMKKALEEE